VSRRTRARTAGSEWDNDLVETPEGKPAWFGA
jgi:hypothetical protein